MGVLKPRIAVARLDIQSFQNSYKTTITLESFMIINCTIFTVLQPAIFQYLLILCRDHLLYEVCHPFPLWTLEAQLIEEWQYELSGSMIHNEPCIFLV